MARRFALLASTGVAEPAGRSQGGALRQPLRLLPAQLAGLAVAAVPEVSRPFQDVLLDFSSGFLEGA
jgi:hypothetical protein